MPRPTPDLTKHPPDLTSDDQVELVRLAMATIRSGLHQQPIAGLTAPTSPRLRALGASFVTLEHDGELLGCIGSLEPARPLFEDVMGNAYKSAFTDPRLPPVTSDDYAVMDVKVSVLGELELITAPTREVLLAVLRPGIDGLLLADECNQATFLPAVWRKVDRSEEFIKLLLTKGGWPSNGWPSDVSAFRYSTVEVVDPGPRTIDGV